ncbi:MAG: flagellar protein FliT [Gammaproteobacteria bacterium]|nr:flagellar protein FliT [Gammaproteobacteria bacterium]
MPIAERDSTARPANAWQEVVSLTRAMMDSVRAGEIDHMVALEGQRHRLLAVVFSANEARPSAAEIQQVMTMDAEIMRGAEILRGGLLEKLDTLSINRKAVAAYGQFQRSGA